MDDDLAIAIAYIPKVGHCVRLQGAGSEPPLSAHLAAALPDYSFAFSTDEEHAGASHFYFSDVCRALDEKFGDVYHRILDLEALLLGQLKERVLAQTAGLLAASGAAAEADCLLALARAAQAFGLRRPTLSRDPVLRIKGGRHLLVQRVVDTFVPNSLECGASAGRICVLTGPNGSGKSVMLKQTALIVYLAHVGSFVPADEAVVGMTDRIFTRLASRESLGAAVQQSSFSRDLSQMANALRHATQRSLVVVRGRSSALLDLTAAPSQVDEFGKGTLPLDGVALLAAALNSLSSRQPAPPITLVATHFSELADPAVLRPHPAIAFLHMRVLERPAAAAAADEERGSIVFLYRLEAGLAKSSFGLHCARLAGAPAPVLHRAQEILDLAAAGAPVEPLNTGQQQARARRFAAMAQLLREYDAASGEEPRAFLARALALPEAVMEGEEEG